MNQAIIPWNRRTTVDMTKESQLLTPKLGLPVNAAKGSAPGKAA